jgi:hypothetical protein
MQLKFNETKATQAAARFIELAGGRLNYMVLIKLLYLLDRTALLSWARPVTYDEYYSMKMGPVLSEVHDLMTEMMPDTYWSEYISAPSNWNVELRKAPGLDALSEAEDELIQEVFAGYGKYRDDPFALVKLLHETLPEWTEVTKGRVPLPHRDILKKAGNRSDAEATSIENELLSLAQDYRVLQAR